MNAPAKIEPDNLALWKALAKTDPKHTKGFKRAGGFSGTAIKPIWIIQRLTEQFGPVGMGWGMGHPRFEIVPGHNSEVLVYCTVECWHTHPDNVFVGVGGDKAVTHIKANAQYNRPERWENDDEAFKKAFTDAVGNAFKFVGVGADVHMGLFDDSKYVQRATREFAEARGGQSQPGAVSPPADYTPLGPVVEEPVSTEYKFPEGPAKNITALKAMCRNLWREIEGCGDDSELEPLLGTAENKAIIEQLGKLEHPEHRKIWEGDGGDNPGISGLINRKRAEFAQAPMNPLAAG